MKLFNVLLLLSAVLLLVCGSFSIQAAEISVGATGMYASWDPMWRDSSYYKYSNSTYSALHTRSYESNNRFMFGPVVSFKINKSASVAANFITTKNFQSDLKSNYKDSTGASMSDTYSEEIIKTSNRIDSDLTFNYNLNQWIKIFTGLKYIRYTSEINTSGNNIGYILTYTSHVEMINTSFGPGIGVGLTAPLFENLYLLHNVSVFYLKTKWEYSHFGYYTNTGSIINSYDNESFNCYGFNSNMALAYYFSDIQTTITIGFRYQLQVPAESEKDKRNDRFYGAYLTAVYSLSFSE
jgi:hypothetical protein